MLYTSFDDSHNVPTALGVGGVCHQNSPLPFRERGRGEGILSYLTVSGEPNHA
jgi:hypothetical protein